MRKLFGRIALAAFGLGLVTGPAAAQLGVQPVYAIPKGTGVSINGDLGYSIDPSGGENLAVRATLGLPMIGFQAGVQPELLDAGETSILAGAAVTLMPMPVTLRLQAGVGYGLDSELINVPAGVVVGLNVPSPMLSVEPWIYPQIRYRRVSALGITASDTDFGVSAGVSVGLPGGIGGHAALDYDNAGEAITAGIGVHYKISVPGLGMVPGM